MGVAIDTFVVRIVVVPAVVTCLSFGGMNWWPTKMPDPVLSPEDEYLALVSGQWVPVLNGEEVKPALENGPYAGVKGDEMPSAA